jgi:mono/diheme cytochrome c family protein
LTFPSVETVSSALKGDDIMARQAIRRSKGLWALGGALLFVTGLWWFGSNRSGVSPIAVTVPELSRPALAGQKAFLENCAACHGEFAGGTDQGPPLVHKIYEPGHHADAAFVLAAKRGVTQHHWSFGNMPSQPQVGERALQQIIEFVRELQVANGI